MDEAEFEVSGFLDVFFGLVLRGLRKTRQLNHDVVQADRLNDRFGHAEISTRCRSTSAACETRRWRSSDLMAILLPLVSTLTSNT